MTRAIRVWVGPERLEVIGREVNCDAILAEPVAGSANWAVADSTPTAPPWQATFDFLGELPIGQPADLVTL